MADSKKYDDSQWKHSLRKLTTATEAVENPLYSDGTAITAYTLKGNTTTSGTPTPSNPITISGVGNKTANLYDISSTISGKILNLENGKLIDNSNYLTSDYKLLSAGVYTLSMINEYTGTSTTTNRLAVYDLNKTFIGFIVDVTNVRPSTPIYTFTLDTDCYIRISVRVTDTSIMLNTGSTALPYEPYGYKIPILSGGVTTNIYLGSTQTVRQVKKLVLTGDENWVRTSTGTTHNRYQLVISDILPFGTRLTPMFCTHYQNICDGRSIGDVPDNSIYSGQSQDVYIKTTSITSLTDFKAYLAAQYANGTPVTVWYVLATAETAALNEPLMKISDYADTLSNAAQIPTTEGANSITVDTTVQPSEFTATWTGWHDASVKEWDGSQWD